MATNSNLADQLITPLSRAALKQSATSFQTRVNPLDMMQQILPEDLFLGMLCLDRKRAERSGKKLLLLLIDAEDAEKSSRKQPILDSIVKACNAARRETDPAGWYKQDAILGIIFSELGSLDAAAAINKLCDKVRESLVVNLTADDIKHIYLSIHVFGADSDGDNSTTVVNPTFYPDLFQQHKTKKLSLVAKRTMDVAVSFAILVLLSPLYLLIASIVKLTSNGPVFFKQERLGQFGKTFTCLKFRSMRANNDLAIHREFMKKVIKGTHNGHSNGNAAPVYKMTDDPRITRIGKLLRRTSLDELPQFINILRGEMSLVGPRPPLAYEFEEYNVWHRRRVLEVKPGLTGLWQVRGRSRVRFDDMVRLDLQYAREWSLWLDVQILLETPRAVVFGDGAY